jgi:two-component system chemotaxis sensor kinase CheA
MVTEVSGRGVGLDVVCEAVLALHGAVDIAFEPGRGTTFTLTVPLTLTTLRALLLAAGGQTFALAGVSVQRLLRVDPSDFVAVEGREMLRLGERPVPIVSLADTLGLRAGGAHRPTDKALVVLVAAGGREVGFLVDELLSEEEVVVKTLGARLVRVRHVVGATILASGKVALILSAADLVRTALRRSPGKSLGASLRAPARASKKRLLVVDDSVTTRTLERTILEAAGYDVTVASDGAEAWRMLQDDPRDLVVSDVEMPRMDGFALTEAIRASRRLRELPVVLVTALASEGDKMRGLESGANAYLVKSAFDQQGLLETIAQLL